MDEKQWHLMLAMLWDEFLYVDLADHVLGGCVAT